MFEVIIKWDGHKDYGSLNCQEASPFDYTIWQEDLFEDVSFEELGELAMKHYKKT